MVEQLFFWQQLLEEAIQVCMLGSAHHMQLLCRPKSDDSPGRGSRTTKRSAHDRGLHFCALLHVYLRMQDYWKSADRSHVVNYETSAAKLPLGSATTLVRASMHGWSYTD